MFCSKCGKTLTLEDQQCPHCGNPVGESRFEGTPYTSAQPHILPNAPVKQATAAYTRTTYTTMSENQQQAGAVDSRTTYRPVYEGASAPEDIRRDMRAAVSGADEKQPERPEVVMEELSDEAKDTLNAVEEELKMEDMDTSQLHSRPIESTGRAGISAGVEDYIQKLEANQTRRAARRRRGAELPVEEDAYATPEDQMVYDDYRDDPGMDDGQSEVFDDIGEDEFDDMRYGRTLGLKDILKVALIMVLAAALIVGGVLWFRRVRQSTSSAPIEGVSESLYTDGIELIKSHAEDSYISELVNIYSTDGSLSLANRVMNDTAAIDALLPAEPAANDPLFISALQAIQKNIGNAILSDATQAAAGSENAEASQARWGIVNNAISQLEEATTAAELTAILNGEEVTVVTEPTPSPTPEAVTYETLAKGAKSDAVLELQNRLYELGYLNDDRDGNFGNKTQTAVKKFQAAVGLEATGIADAETQTRLFADDAPATDTAPAAAGQVAADTAADTAADDTADLLNEDEFNEGAIELGDSEEDLA